MTKSSSLTSDIDVQKNIPGSAAWASWRAFGDDDDGMMMDDGWWMMLHYNYAPQG